MLGNNMVFKEIFNKEVICQYVQKNNKKFIIKLKINSKKKKYSNLAKIKDLIEIKNKS